MKNNNTKQILALLDKPYTAQLCMHIVQECSMDVNSGDDIGVGTIAVARYTNRIISRVRNKLNKELKKETIVSTQTDLVDLINLIKEEEYKKKVT